MPDQDPPIEPLRRMDPAEPDEQGLGRLERLDPDADESPAARSAAGPPAKPSSRLRDGLSAAITLAVLLSLSSIAAIGGLVAISMGTAVPAGPGAVGSVETGVPITTIRVGESAQGLEEEQEPDRADADPQAPADDVVVPAPPPAPQPPVSEAGGEGAGGGGNDKGNGGGGHGGKKGYGGGWCDARAGGACDAVAGGSVLQPATEPEGDGFVPSDDDEPEDDDHDDDDGGSSSGSGSSHHSGKGH